MFERLSRLAVRFLLPGALAFLTAISVRAQEAITGQVGNPGIEGALVFLCDAASGIPISPATRQVSAGSNLSAFLCVTTAPSGSFSFTNIPPGNYRLVAESFVQPVPRKVSLVTNIAWPATLSVALHGVAENIAVPSPEAGHVLILPLGQGSLTLDQETGNDDVFALLSLKPITGDPILGFLGWNRDFMSHLIGFGRIATGSTIIFTGLPDTNFQAVIYASESSPGFGAAYYRRLPSTAQKIPVVASWTDAQHIPPPRIQRILDALSAAHTTPAEVLKFQRPAPAKLVEYLKALAEALGPLDREVALPNGEKATVADLYAAMNYQRLGEHPEKRIPAR